MLHDINVNNNLKLNEGVNNNEKKFTMLLSALILSVAIPSITSYATNHWQLSDRTYVHNEHEGFWSDTYIGTVSVYGKDVLVEGQYFYYPNFSRITYDVQGDISREQVDSYGENDSIQRTSQITVTISGIWALKLKFITILENRKEILMYNLMIYLT